jgi:glycosyltransferase involved in cell wall biosynthesis
MAPSGTTPRLGGPEAPALATEPATSAPEIQVLTNLTRLAAMPYEGVAFRFDLYASHGFAAAVRAFFRSFRHDYILLNGTVRDALVLGMLKLLVPLHSAKIVLLDIMLSTPEGLSGRVKAWIIGRLLRRTHRILVYYHNTSGLQRHYGIPADRFRFIPFKINQREMISRLTPVDGGYVFCGGKTRRDFATFFQAVDGLDLPVRVVTTSNIDIARHGSFVDESAAPANVEVVRLDGSPEAFLSHMASARVVVLPITPEICGAGISVYVQAMALRKCVILSAGPGAEDVLTSEQAIIIPPSDPLALRRAIERAFGDPDYRASYEQKGYEWASTLGGEDQLYSSVLRLVRDDYRTAHGMD